MLRTLGVSALAATASALLLPPGMASVAGSGSDTAALAMVDPFTQLLGVDCPGCLYGQPKEDGTIIWTEGVQNSLYVNISVGANTETLELNGVQIYPPIEALTADPVAPYITQAPRDTPLNEVWKNTDRFVSLRLTSWSLKSEQIVTPGVVDEELYKIRFSMKALAGQQIQVEDIGIDLLKRSSGFMLLATEKLAPLSPAEECSTFPLLCQWRALLTSKLESMRTKFHGKCGHHKMGQMGAHKRPHPHHHHADGKRPHHQMNGHHKGGKHHHHQQMTGSHHQTLNAIAHFLLIVVIPILVGVLAGMLTYLVGMLIGTALALLWTRFRRRRGAYQPIALEDGDVIVVDIENEKEVVPAEAYVDAPPQYIEKELAQD